MTLVDDLGERMLAVGGSLAAIGPTFLWMRNTGGGVGQALSLAPLRGSAERAISLAFCWAFSGLREVDVDGCFGPIPRVLSHGGKAR